MKTQKTETVITDHGNLLTVEDLTIDKAERTGSESERRKNFNLTIDNTDKGRLALVFKETDVKDGGIFEIKIRDGKLFFTRYCARPGHDHDDYQHLVISLGVDKAEKIKEDSLLENVNGIYWTSGYPSKCIGETNVTVPFGSVTYPEYGH
jgi:hypothetical protein